MTDYFDAYRVNSRIDTLDVEVNKLPVNLLDFALISALRHRAYGVRTFDDESCTQYCTLNSRARQDIWRMLFNIQQNVIGKKRTYAAPTYVSETQVIDPSATVFYARFGSIESVNVTEELSFVTNLDVSPFVLHDVHLQMDPTSSFVEAHFDSTVAKNPHKVILRDTNTYEQFPWQEQPGYPTKNGFNWVMPVGNSLSDITRLASIQDYEYMIAEIDEISGISLDDLVVLHPGSQQILPFAKAPERVLYGGVWRWRFWFYAWTLGRPEFDDSIDLVEGEFEKLYDVLELYQRTEVHKPGVVYIDDDDEPCDATPLTDEEETMIVKIVSGRSGALKYGEVSGTYPSYKYSSMSTQGNRYKVKYYYKVNPYLYGIATEEIRRAIVAKVAANLNLEACNCVYPANDSDPGKMDYITEMQRPYTRESVSPMTGVVAVTFLYGNRHGDHVFAEMMEKLEIRPRVVMA